MQSILTNIQFSRFFRTVGIHSAITLLVLLYANNTIAQSDSLWHPVYKQYTIKDGLPSMELYYSFQDDNGYIWFASDRGVVRYNGDKFETFTTDDGLVSNTVFKIDQDDKGRIWFLSDVPKLCYFENDQFKQYKYNTVFQDFFSNNKTIRSFTAWNFDNDRVLLCTENHGAVRIDKNGKLTRPHEEFQCDIEKPYSKLFFKEGLIMNGLKSQIPGVDPPLVCFDNRNHAQLPSQGLIRFMKTGWINKEDYYIAGNFDLYISAKSGDNLYHFQKRIFACTVIDDELWLGVSGGGVEVYSINGHEITKKAHYLKNLHVTSINRTREGHYWFATLYNGLFVIENMEITKLDKANYNAKSFIFLAKRKNDLFLLDGSKRVSFLNLNTGNNSEGSFPIPTKIRSCFSDIHTDEIFIVEILKMRVINYANGKQLVESVVRKNDLLNNLSDEAYVTAENVIKPVASDYVFWNGGGLFFQKEDIYISLEKSKHSIELEDPNTIWLTGPLGARSVNLSTFEIQSPKSKLLHQRINSIHKSKGMLFFGTHGNGVIIKEGRKVSQLSIENGKVRKYVNKIVSKNNGPVWLMGNAGISKLVYSGGIGYETDEFDLNDLDCEKINDAYPDHNYLYVATNNGIRRIKGGKAISKKAILKLYLKSVEVGNSEIKKSAFKLNYDENNLVIRYDAVSFESEPVKFRYRLSKEDNWITIEERFIRLNALESGAYSFEIQASVNGLNWTDSEKLEIHISPPFWKTWWFIILEILLGITIVIAGVALRLRIVNKRHAENQNLMELEQKMLELRQEALTQQMNPHFIFNALGSVQNSILKGDSRQANKYLVKFSKLLRAGLNASRSQLIPIEEDVELMESYLAVEKTRMGEFFTFDVEFKSKSKPYSLNISPFLLQPFLENAIKHGIGEDHPSGKVTVMYEEEEDCIRCTIMDNGKGRQAAKSMRIPGHTSHGSEIAFGRIELFNKSQGSIGEHRIEDLHDAENNPIGTKVVFTVPIIRK